MKFSETQVGQHYYLTPLGCTLVIGECVELGDKMLMRGEELFHADEVTDIHRVPSAEEVEALVIAAKRVSDALEVAVLAGLSGFSTEEEDEIVANHVALKPLRAALAAMGE